MKSEIRTITPDIAKQMLEQNTSNRRPKKPVILRYHDDMVNGRWNEDTGESLKVAKSGRLLDGQQRLMAQVKAGVTLNYLVVSELDEDVFKVLDTGSVRGAKEVFLISGAKNETLLPAIIQFKHLMQSGCVTNAQKNTRLTNAQLLDAYLSNEFLWQDIVKKSHVWYNQFSKILRQSWIGAFYAIFSEINEDDADTFMTMLCNDDAEKFKSVSLLRNQLFADIKNKRKMPPTLKSAVIIKAWNAFRRKEEIKTLRFSNYETFPIPE